LAPRSLIGTVIAGNALCFQSVRLGPTRAIMTGVMILLISSIAKAHDCIRAIQDATNESVKVCASPPEAVADLQAQQFSAVIFDQVLLDSDPDEGRAVLKHLGTAAPVYVNFAISATGRIVRELRAALQRRKRELEAARQDAERILRNELNNSVTALLLSCEMALQVPGLPALAESKIQNVEALVKKMSATLAAIA
jgi:hypothetical protein